MTIAIENPSREFHCSTKINPDLAYLCGVFAGDGSISIRNDKHEYSLKCVGNPKDEKEFYELIITSLFKKVFNVKISAKYFDSGTTFGFRIFSKELIIYLTKFIGLPVGKKYANICIPHLFYENRCYLISFIRGVFDTDGCISFKKRYRTYPYYPVISLSSKSKGFVKQIADVLKQENFRVVESYEYRVKDWRNKNGFTTISRIELNGKYNLDLWLQKIGFHSPKHQNKIKELKKK